MTFPEDLMKELVTLATKYHVQDILDDLPSMIEPEYRGVRNYLRRIAHECNSDGC